MTYSYGLPDAVSEWFSTFNGFMHGCGEASVVVIGHLLAGEALSTDEVTSTIQQAVAAGQADNTGATSPSGQAWLLNQRGITTQQFGGGDLGTVLQTYADKVPILVDVLDAGAGFGPTDSFRGGHSIVVLGRDQQTGKYVVADPNTQAAVQGAPVEYSLSQLTNAKPFAELVPTSVSGSGPIGGNPFPGITLPFLSGIVDGTSALIAIGKDITATFNFVRSGDMLKLVFGFILVLLALWIFFQPQMKQAVLTGVQVAGATAG